ncbi:unnamed protein product [Thelazia callipaeda]|uniref:SERPIN domain-containing protein n=1 Tax=Thelazia callipaeda TaxID=103827 RepID=A0A0N5D0I1_THECL|nr:unnamed protein product [Thelazia callipaeda]
MLVCVRWQICSETSWVSLSSNTVNGLNQRAKNVFASVVGGLRVDVDHPQSYRRVAFPFVFINDVKDSVCEVV